MLAPLSYELAEYRPTTVVEYKQHLEHLWRKDTRNGIEMQFQLYVKV